MMPQEKARELINKFLRIEDDTTFYWEALYDKQYTDEEVMDHAKKCSIIVIDEILSVIPMYIGELNPTWKYWAGVKQEIEKL